MKSQTKRSGRPSLLGELFRTKKLGAMGLVILDRKSVV